MIDLNQKILSSKNIHFIGIGGIGMSALALILLKMGYKVSGSDLEMNNLTAKLTKMGANIFTGHNNWNLPPETEAVIYSSSISGSNPEIEETRKRGIPL